MDVGALRQPVLLRQPQIVWEPFGGCFTFLRMVPPAVRSGEMCKSGCRQYTFVSIFATCLDKQSDLVLEMI